MVDGSLASIGAVFVIYGGTGYTIPPIITIDPPTSPTIQYGGIQATAVATINDTGSVIYIEVTNDGYGYDAGANPQVHISVPSVQSLEVEQNALTTASMAHNSTIVDPKSLYNYRISPARNAMRWFKSIAQSYADWIHAVLHFVSGEANITARGQYEGISGVVPVIENTVLAEDDNITYDIFTDAADHYPIYSNEMVKFVYPLSYNDWVTKIVPNPCGLIQYSVNDGAPQYGWIDDLKYSPFEGTAEFVLKKKI
jgi:hypothetical protein